MIKIYKKGYLHPKKNESLSRMKCVWLGIVFVLCTVTHALAQEAKISGTVKDEKGETLPGVSVKVKGSTVITVSDPKGNYSITAPKNAVLLFSYVGYQAQEKPVGTGVVVNVTMLPDAGSLSEVVVVGYGTQKKVNLTGSIATISGKDIENRPVTNLSNSLAGLASGLYSNQSSGQPGSDASSLSIRGLSTLSSSSVLVLIDGISGSIDAVNPQDVESVTVLKDAASTAIYGSLAANGVILITTKKGSGKPTLSYSGIFSSTRPSQLPKFVTNSVDYMRLINEASANIGGAVIYSPDIIQPYIDAASNPDGTTAQGIPNDVAYANTDWAKTTINRSALQNNNISLNGKSESTSYLLSLGYINNPGIIDNTAYSDYRFRINLETKINDYITVGTNTFGDLGKYSLTNVSDFLNFLRQIAPMAYPYYDGYYGIDPVPVNGSTGNVLSRLRGTKGNRISTNISSTWYVKANLAKGLTFEPRISYAPKFNETNSFTDPQSLRFKNFQMNAITQSNDQADPVNSTTANTFSKSYNMTMESLLRYNTNFGEKHHLGLLAGYNQYKVYAYATSITAKGLVDGSVTAISTASSFPTNPTGSAGDNYAFRSFFGRLNYSYVDKYLFEANLRRDGSSKFGPVNQFGYFPSFSAGWNLDKEAFLKNFLEKIKVNTFKIRASWGRVGNVASGNYDWQSLYSTTSATTTAYSLNGTSVVGLYTSKIGNPALHWETTEETDFGIDLTALKGLSFTADWFSKKTSGILFLPTIDITHGTATAPTVNLAGVSAKGMEFTLGWQGNKGQLHYSATANLAYYYKNQVTNYKGLIATTYGVNAVDGSVSTSNNVSAVSSGGNNRVVEGHLINEFYLQTVYKGSGTYTTATGAVDPKGGPKDGMIRTDADLNWVIAMKAAGYSFGPVNTVAAGNLYKGDLLYSDNNNDGVYGNAGDAQFQNYSTLPKYVFGLNLNASYKGFNLSVILAGGAGMKFYTNYAYINSSFVRLASSIPQQVADDHYSASNLNGYYPRIKTADVINDVASDFWLKNGSYLKIKNVQLGYTIPESLMNRLGGVVKSLNFYVTGENILTLSAYKLGDPEQGSLGTPYPIMKQFSLGVNAKF
ncbi:TonB-dependent receptor [Pedobacter sp. BMA]|uniref:SusC/RagA family TonB-linked outer membrane protein n=1 Tax=Pedobacter sp. BMA TaxID=1663685 RepID=UPI00069EB9C9|nr:TonB-dependent receptor [Pedobacter sp. BMA]